MADIRSEAGLLVAMTLPGGLTCGKVNFVGEGVAAPSEAE